MNENIELSTKFVQIALVNISFVATAMPPILLTLINYLFHDLGDEMYIGYEAMYVRKEFNFIQFIECVIFVHLRVPFHWRSAFGYIMYLMFYVPGIFCVIYAAVPPICFYAGSCFLFIAFVQDIENDLNALMVKKSHRKHNAKLKTQFFRIVQVYSEVKELSYQMFDSNDSVS